MAFVLIILYVWTPFPVLSYDTALENKIYFSILVCQTFYIVANGGSRFFDFESRKVIISLN